MSEVIEGGRLHFRVPENGDWFGVVDENGVDEIYVHWGDKLLLVPDAFQEAEKVHWLKWVVAFFILEPFINRDLRLREIGKRPDRMHWADRVATLLGVWHLIQYEELAYD